MSWNLVLTFIGLILAMIGVIFVYDARILTKRFFSFGDQNQASLGFKILGFIIAIIGGILIYFNVQGGILYGIQKIWK